MRARNASVFVAGLVVAVIGACSNPSADTAREGGSELAAELELALFGAASSTADGNVAVSELELARPRSPELAASPPPRRAPAPATAVADPAMQLLGEEITVAMAPAPAEAPAIVEAVETTGGANADDERGIDVGRAISIGRGIIIRGGVSGRDPCAIHLPGSRGIPASDPRGRVGIAINDQSPRIGRGAYPVPDRGRMPLGGGGFHPGGIR